jgi:tetratricopeptide (TPR) repeat protein
LPIEFASNILFAYVHYRLADYVKAQEYAAKASTIVDAIPNNANYLAVAINMKAKFEKDPVKKYTLLKDAISHCTNEAFKEVILRNTAIVYLDNNQTDSALVYAQKANEICLKTNDSLEIDLSRVFGMIYLRMNQPEIAYGYLKKGMEVIVKTNEPFYLLKGYSSMALYFKSVKNNDSTLVYIKKPFMFELQEAYPYKVASSKWLYEYYLKNNQQDSAIKYLIFYALGNDSLYSSDKIQELQLSKIKEELREKDFEKAKEEENENRQHNLQLAITAIAILSAVMLDLFHNSLSLLLYGSI